MAACWSVHAVDGRRSRACGATGLVGGSSFSRFEGGAQRCGFGPATAKVPSMQPNVTSEVGALRQVIVHRPGAELTRLTPSNKDALLFDDVLWVERAVAEHDAFCAVLTHAGTVVHHFDDLLRTTLAIDEARRFVLDLICDESVYGPSLSAGLHEHLLPVTVAELYDVLVGGLTKEECRDQMPVPESVVFGIAKEREFLLNPLTNHLFARDASCWIGQGVAENSMHTLARRRETVNYQAIYRWHPLFADAQFAHWSDGISAGPATMEGGDVLVVAPDALVIGLSERTSPSAVERLARRLFEDSDVRRILAVRLPKRREFMHLDTVLTMADADTFMAYAGLGDPETFLVEPGAPQRHLKITALQDGLAAALARTLGIPSVRLL